MLVMGLVESWLMIFAIPGAFLVGLAFGSVGLAASTYMRSWQDFDLVNLVTLPLFLFSGTFYPIDLYPPLVQQLARLSPLYHGTELIRGFTLGVLDWSMIGHTAFLLTMALIGGIIANHRFDSLLRK
jgi:lipooligosaccharide transport system permease protein